MMTTVEAWKILGTEDPKNGEIVAWADDIAEGDGDHSLLEEAAKFFGFELLENENGDLELYRDQK